jgi:ribosomal protein S18 acetylase RimI-like enzyme
MHVRPYDSLADLAAMHALLSAGAAAGSEAYYVHPGDLSWWLFYTTDPAPLTERVRIWEDGGAVIGWSLQTAEEGQFDLFVDPAWLGRPEYAAMHATEARHAEDLARARGGSTIGVMWISEQDTGRQAILKEQGFRRDDAAPRVRLVSFRQATDAQASESSLPDGCRLYRVRGEADLEARALPQAAAFKSKLSWDQYLTRYRRFMGSPVYAGAHDVGLVGPDGAFVAATIWWVDAINSVGHFEPVATHPDHHRRGYGRALLRACLGQMRAEGLTSATVCADADSAGNIAFYRACGFEAEARLDYYERRLEA